MPPSLLPRSPPHAHSGRRSSDLQGPSADSPHLEGPCSTFVRPDPTTSPSQHFAQSSGVQLGKYGHFWFFILVLPEWIEHSTSPLPRVYGPVDKLLRIKRFPFSR